MEKNNYIDYKVINDIQDSANILDIISHYISLKRKGSSYFGLCPFHNDSHPSLSVNPKKKIWKCFVCGAKGNVFNFVQKIENISYLEAVKKVAELSNYDLSKVNFISHNPNALTDKQLRLIQANNRANEFYTGILYNDENKFVVDYLTKRGLTKEIIKQFKIGYAIDSKTQMLDWLTNKDEYFGKLDKSKVFNEQELIDAGIAISNSNNEIHAFLINRITFPIYDINNNLVGFSGRDVSGKSEAKYLHTSSTLVFNKSKTLYNLNVIKNHIIESLIIVEGFMDCIAYYRAGYNHCIATMGVALTKEHISMLNTLNGLKYVILSFDNDNAGLLANIQNAKLLIENGYTVSIANYEDFIEKDIDEIINKNGIDSAKTVIDNRLDFITFLIKKTLNKKMPFDELTQNINNLLSDVIEYGDVLLRTKHLELIAKLSDLNIIDINNKYNDLLNGKYSQNQFHSYKTNTKYSKPLKNKTIDKIDGHQENKEHIEHLLEEEINDHDLLKDIQTNCEQKIVERNLIANKCLIELIKLALVTPQSYPDFSDRLSFGEYCGSEKYKKTIKAIGYILSTIDTLPSSQELINKLMVYLKDNSGSDQMGEIYQEAYEFIEKLNVSFFSKPLKVAPYKQNINERIEQIISRFTENKFRLSIFNKLLDAIKIKTSNSIDDNEKEIQIRHIINEINHIREVEHKYLMNKESKKK